MGWPTTGLAWHALMSQISCRRRESRTRRRQRFRRPISRIQNSERDFFGEKDKTQQESPYERLLTDAMHGDKLLFIREDVVEAAWSIVDPILNNAVPLVTYNPGTWGASR